jgi:hypothetical protein
VLGGRNNTSGEADYPDARRSRMRDQSSPTHAPPRSAESEPAPALRPPGGTPSTGEGGSRLQVRRRGGGGGDQHLPWIVRPRSRSGRRCAAGFVVAWGQGGFRTVGVGFRSWGLDSPPTLARSPRRCDRVGGSWMLDGIQSCQPRARGFKRGSGCRFGLWLAAVIVISGWSKMEAQRTRGV